MPGSEAPHRLPNVLQGRYRLGEVLGRGSASVVLHAHDELLARDVAVKIFTARASDAHELRVQETEARMLGSLNHHALVTLLDAGIDLTDPEEPQVFLVLELIRDSDLGTRLAGGPLEPVQAAYLGFDLAGALAYVHAHGIVHRDLKPANVLLVESGGRRPARAKLADFGIALLRGHTEGVGQASGTAAYLSPEQVEGAPLTAATDVYSLGLVLLEALTGRPAFPGSVMDSALARLEHGPDIPDGIPTPLAEALRAMTLRDPTARATAQQAEAALRSYIVHTLGGQTKVTTPEQARVAALRRYNLLDTPPDDSFDRITALAARIFAVPVSIIALVDEHRLWLKSAFGTELPQVAPSRDRAAGGGLHDGTLVIEDLDSDPRVAELPSVARADGLRFYAGAPLITADGYNLGMLAVIDGTPHRLSADQVAVLEDLAAMVLHEMELRLAARRAVLQRDD